MQWVSDLAISGVSAEAVPAPNAVRALTDRAAAMARYGQARWRGEYDIFEPGPYDLELKNLSPDGQQVWVGTLAQEVLPVGGWAVYGAEETVMRALGHPIESPAYCAILKAALDFQRGHGVWWAQLSVNEQAYWEQQHPDERWLDPRPVPSREAARISPLASEEERKLCAMTRAPDSKAIFVTCVAHTYWWSLDYPDETGRRTREVGGEADDLYDLYVRLAGNPPPSYWVHPEFEPFLPFPVPRI